MPVYDYKAKDSAGASITGAVEAPNDVVAQDTLKERGLTVVNLNERKRNTLFHSLTVFQKKMSCSLLVSSRS